MFATLTRFFSTRKTVLTRLKAKSDQNSQNRSISMLIKAFGPTFSQSLSLSKGISISEYCKKALIAGPEELGKAWSVMSTRVLLRMAEEVRTDEGLKRRLLERDFALEARSYLLEKWREEWNSAISIAKMTDLSMPHEWYPRTRELTRRIEYHWGPTNSGKTYSALNRLKTAKTGVYCGPLRLLATEVYEKLNASGVKCNLLTGQERIAVPGATHIACTIETLDIENYYDVAVIDEIQMIADENRGAAWTHALLGLNCTEIHLTGDERAKSIVEKLMKYTEDLLLFTEYKRLSPLTVQPILSTLDDLQPGDCIVAFSRKTCHKLRNLVEKRFKCSIIYGNLPPETRRVQARKFNEREETKMLVATDAIGMGLNYNINRIIFYETEKNDGTRVRPLTPHEIRQISGRAGRFQQPGFVTAFDSPDLNRISLSLSSKLPEKQFKRAALFPSFEQLESFAHDVQMHSNHVLSYAEVLRKFADLVNIEGHYFLQNMKDVVFLAEKVGHVGLDLRDMFVFTRAPVRVTIPSNVYGFVRIAEDFHRNKKVKLRGIREKGDKLEKLEHYYFCN